MKKGKTQLLNADLLIYFEFIISNLTAALFGWYLKPFTDIQTEQRRQQMRLQLKKIFKKKKLIGFIWFNYVRRIDPH